MAAPAPVEAPQRWRAHRRALSICGIVLAIWGAAAYLVLPVVWSHHAHQPGLAAKPMLTVTAQGIHGDPINVGLVGNQAEIIRALGTAGWVPADAVTMLSSFKIGASVVFNRSYPAAPISNLFYEGRAQDLGFERAEGRSAKRRHHVRFWLTLQTGAEGRQVWLGAASFDRGVGLSHYTWQITHRVDPDLDAERNLLIEDLTRARMLATIYHVAGVGPTADGRNGGGDRFFTDGDVTMGVVTPHDAPRNAPPTVLSDPPPVEAKNRLWASVRRLFGKGS